MWGSAGDFVIGYGVDNGHDMVRDFKDGVERIVVAGRKDTDTNYIVWEQDGDDVLVRFYKAPFQSEVQHHWRW